MRNATSLHGFGGGADEQRDVVVKMEVITSACLL